MTKVLIRWKRGVEGYVMVPNEGVQGGDTMEVQGKTVQLCGTDAMGVKIYAETEPLPVLAAQGLVAAQAEVKAEAQGNLPGAIVLPPPEGS